MPLVAAGVARGPKPSRRGAEPLDKLNYPGALASPPAAPTSGGGQKRVAIAPALNNVQRAEADRVRRTHRHLAPDASSGRRVMDLLREVAAGPGAAPSSSSRTTTGFSISPIASWQWKTDAL